MSKSQHREFSEIPITVDRGSDTPLATQITAALRELIDRQTLRPGEPVPATRTLASNLGVARGVVVAAYAQLIAEGYLNAHHGLGTRVHPKLQQVSDAAVAAQSVLPAPQTGTAPEHPGIIQPRDPTPAPFTPGQPDTSTLDTPAWRAAWRHATTHPLHETPPLGEHRLRTEITEHLRRARGTTRPATDVIVTAGAREGFALLLGALSAQQNRPLTVGVEDPGYRSLRDIALQHRAEILALPVDGEGLVTRTLPNTPLDIVLVTPGHQYPLGGSLPLHRRRELLEWAQRNGSIVVEDDYDSELRHAGTPLPALAALDNRQSGVVALLGTFSKTVSPALAAGFLLIPGNLQPMLASVRQHLGNPVSTIVQTALAEYLASGELRKHTARMRRRYARRRELVVEHLFGIDTTRVRPMSGGLHAVIELLHATAADEQRVHARCAPFGAVPLSTYWHDSSATGNHFGLVIGTGSTLDDAQFTDALARLRHAVTQGVRVP